MKLKKFVRPLATVIAAAGFSASAQTTNGTWTNLSGGSWTAGSNWQGGIIADGVDALADFSTLNITASTTVTLDGVRTIGSLKFGDTTTASNDWTLAVGTGDPLTLDVSTGAASIQVVNRTATISAILAGSDGINVSGAGTLALTGTNTYSGQTTVASGATLLINSNGSLGANGVGNETIIQSGGVLNLVVSTNQAIIAERINVAGTGINNAGAIVNTAASNWAVLQNVTLTAPTSIGGSTRINISGGTLDLAGNKLTKVGANQVAITGGTVTNGDIDVLSGNLSFEAGAAVKGTGTISVASGAILGLWANTAGAQTRAVTLNGGAILRELGSNSITSTFSSPITLKGDATIDVIPGGGGLTNLTLNGGIGENGGSFGFTRTGTGKLTLAGANTFTGTLNLTAGTTVLATGATLSAGTINLASGAVFDSSPAGGFTLGSGKTLVAGRTGTPASDIIGPFTADAGSLVDIGGTGVIRTASFGNDLMLNGSTLRFDLGNTTTPGGSANDLVAVTGNLTLSGTNTINVRTAGVPLVAGSYTLATYTGTLTGNAGNLAVNVPTTTRQTFTPDTTTTNGSVLLKVAGNAANLTWVGNAANNTWDLNSTASFSDGTTGQKFFNLDSVNFTDSGVASSSVNLVGTLQPSAVVVDNTTKNYTFGGTGTLSGNAILTKTGAGKLTITGTSHDFSGGVNFNGGTVSIAEISNAGLPSALGTGPLNFAGGTLEYTGPNASTNRTLLLGTGGGTLSVADPAATLTLTTSPTGTTKFTKAGAGTLLANYTGTYTGGTTIAEGTLKLANTNALGNSGTPAVTVASGATLDANGQTPGTKINLTISGAGVDGLGALRNSGAGVTNNNIASTITLAGDATVGTNSRYDFVGAVAFSGNTFTLTKAGTGETWWAPTAGATVGNIVVDGGRFGVQSSANLGSTAHSITVNSGATLSTYNTQTNAKPIVLNGGMLHNNSAAPVAGTAGTWTGSLTLSGAGISNRIDTFGGPIVYSGKITGTGGLEKLSTGSTLYGLDLGSPDNDWQGDTQITRGTVRIVGSGKISPNSTLVMNGAQATFDGGGTAQTVAGLRGSAGAVTNVALTVKEIGTDVFSGEMTGAATSFTKEGIGTLTLANTSNTYAGPTVVSEGTLVVNGSIAASPTTVSGGTLAGTGITGALTLNSSGRVAPGEEGIGTLTASSLTWNGGGSLLFELGTSNSSDSFNLGTGVLDKGTAGAFTFNFEGSGVPNSVYTLARFGSTDFLVSDFSYTNLSNGLTGSFQMSGTALQFVTAPEPSTPLMLISAAGTLLGLRRPRRRSC